MATTQPEISHFAGDPDFMLSLARGLMVLQLVVAAQRPVTLAEVSRRSGLSQAAARRCLYTLCQLGYVLRGSNGYTASHDVLTLGSGFRVPNSLAVRAQPLLDALRDECGESCSIGVLDNDHVRYAARAEAARIMSINIRVGTRLPLYATSMGRVLLAAQPQAVREAYLERKPLHRLTPFTVVDKPVLAAILQQVERDGHAIVDQELECGLRSASVPIASANGIEAALNIATPTARVSIDELENRFLPALKRCAAQISPG
jgi:IclR family transcriptional regulator, pca regulon regulatory protein